MSTRFGRTSGAINVRVVLSVFYIRLSKEYLLGVKKYGRWPRTRYETSTPAEMVNTVLIKVYDEIAIRARMGSS